MVEINCQGMSTKECYEHYEKMLSQRPSPPNLGILGLMLLVVSIILSVLFLPVGLLVSLFKRIKEKSLGRYFYWIAYSIDQLGNVICMDFFNYILIEKRSQSKFGDPDETISSVLGKNERDLTLTRMGKGLSWILNKLDPNHTIDAIERFV